MRSTFDGYAITASARGVVRAGLRLQLDGEPAVVVAAVWADMVRQLHLVTVRALLEIRQVDGEMRATLALSGMRDSSLGYTHVVLGSLCRGARSRSKTAFGATAVRVDGGVYPEMGPSVRRGSAGAGHAP